jgi:hypothetical protein
MLKETIMRKYVGITLMLILLGIAACAPVNTKLMHNPVTGDVKECKRDPWKNWTWEEAAVLKRCADEYRKLGYVEADEATIKLPQRSDELSSKTTLTDKLLQLKTARDKGFITEKEYEEHKDILLKKFSRDSETGAPLDRDKTPVQ